MWHQLVSSRRGGVKPPCTPRHSGHCRCPLNHPLGSQNSHIQSEASHLPTLPQAVEQPLEHPEILKVLLPLPCFNERGSVLVLIAKSPHSANQM